MERSAEVNVLYIYYAKGSACAEVELRLLPTHTALLLNVFMSPLHMTLEMANKCEARM